MTQPPRPTRDDPRLGTTIAGCRITRGLGAGAMGAVYLAEREGDGATVVVKLMAPELLASPVARERFAREAHALSRLPPHPNVVHVLAVALDALPPALVMEYAPGEPLDDLLRARGRLAPLEAAQVARDVARGLAVIHAQGLIHRDLKPANVVVGPDGAAKIVDFGVARDSFLSGITAPGQLLGTTLYMAPERLTGDGDEDDDEDDPRGDLWSLGAVLYHLIAGAPPFDTPDLGELMDLVEEGAWTPLEEVLGAPLPPGLGDVVAQLLEPARAHRYGRAADVVCDLEQVLAGREVELPGLVSADGRRAAFPRGVERVVVGHAPGCDLVLDDATVSERHAQVRRTATGYELIDLKSAHGTTVDGFAVRGPVTPRDGARVRVGQVELTFRDPRGREASPVEVPSQTLDAASLEALAAAGDLRLVAWHIERAAADGDPGRAALGWLARTGLAPEVTSAPRWAGWWVGRRTELPPQLGPTDPGGVAADELLLEARRQGQALATRRLGASDVALHVGRDARCELRLESPQVSRLHLTLARLHRRWAFRNESQHGTLLDGQLASSGLLSPGARLLLGDVELTVAGARLM